MALRKGFAVRDIAATIVACFCAGISLSARMQVPATGAVIGVVRDSSGGVMPGALVTANGGGRTAKATSDVSGRYRIAGLTPGTYDVTAELGGFTASSCKALNVVSSGAATCAIELRLGGPPAASDDARRLKLEAAEQLWRRAGFSSYRFTVSVQCFCVFGTAPFSFVVTDGRSQAVGETEQRRQLAAPYYDSAEKLFAIIRRALDRGGFKVDVTYDVATGFPLKADLDPMRLTSDDETVFEVSGLEKTSARPSVVGVEAMRYFTP